MKESAVRAKHEQDVEQAFIVSGCRYFPNSRHIRVWRGKEFFAEVAKIGHNSLDFYQCECRSKITVTTEQEWKSLQQQRF